jgi:uncharacterized alkaline shock family protein YloU
MASGEDRTMSEQDQQRYDSPLVGERGKTTISDAVVTTIAGMAAREVEGVHMGSGASRAAGGVLGSITGSESQTRGVSAEVGQVEAAIDLTMGVEYGRDILRTVDEVRRRISDRVQNMTGLHVTELNTTISEIVFTEVRGRRRVLGDGAMTEGPPLPESTSGPLSEEETPAEGDETSELRPEDLLQTRRTPEEDETRSGEER